MFNLLREGVVAKLENHLHCGGNSPYELLESWTKVLAAFHKKHLRLSVSKTIINPKCTTIHCWTWSKGTLTGNQYQISVVCSCSPPEKVGSMKSFIEAYKILPRVNPACSYHLSPLENAISGRSSTEVTTWTDGRYELFATALSTSGFIILPKPDDNCGPSPMEL